MEQLVKNLENQIELKDFKLNSLLEITTAINSNKNVETITKLFEFIVHEQLGYERFGIVCCELDTKGKYTI